MKCIQCDKKIKSEKILISCDGDFVCSSKCVNDFYLLCGKINMMSSKKFRAWLHE